MYGWHLDGREQQMIRKSFYDRTNHICIVKINNVTRKKGWHYKFKKFTMYAIVLNEIVERPFLYRIQCKTIKLTTLRSKNKILSRLNSRMHVISF